MKKCLIATTLLIAACNQPSVQPAPAVPAATAVVVARTAVPFPITCTPEAVTEVRKGLDLGYDFQQAKSKERFDAALKIDPKCVTAMVFIGQATPGEPGTKLMDAALAGSSALPEAERLLVLHAHQAHHGQTDKTLETATKLVAASPDSWEAYLPLAGEHLARKKWDDAIVQYKKAAELAPTRGVIPNFLGYTYLEQNKFDDAIASFKRYTELAPKEPNSHDSYAEALFAAGKFEESEAAFRKAIELDPEFGSAWQGIAIGKLLRNDGAGAQEAFAKAVATAKLPRERLNFLGQAAFALYVDGKTAEALKALEAIEKEADKGGLPGFQVFGVAHRGVMLAWSEKYPEALKEAAAAEKKVASLKGLTEGQKREFANVVTGLRLRVQSATGKLEDAKTSLAAIEKTAAFDPNDPGSKGYASWAAGVVAYGAKDYKTAIEKFTGCVSTDLECKLNLVQAYEKAGDKAAAETAKAELRKRNVRDPMYVFVNKKLAVTGGGS